MREKRERKKIGAATGAALVRWLASDPRGSAIALKAARDEEQRLELGTPQRKHALRELVAALEEVTVLRSIEEELRA